MFIHDITKLVPKAECVAFATELARVAREREASFDHATGRYTKALHELTGDDNIRLALLVSWNESMMFCREMLGDVEVNRIG